jgi:hypothetical protein
MTLCGLREEQVSVSEGGSGATMATDAQGNLYLPDLFNNRVLRYNNPFATDTVADNVWGQDDLAGVTCNRGAGIFAHSDSKSLCLAPPPRFGDLRAGVAIDGEGNLWVADTQNNRVLRFPFDLASGMPAQEADLVLGQPDFSTITLGASLDQMDKPTSVRVTSLGIVFVADNLNNRVLVFEPPLSNGMLASRVLGNDLLAPQGLEIDTVGGIWVLDSGNHRLVRFLDEVQDVVISEIYSQGSLGIDLDGNILVANDLHEVMHFSIPAYTLDATVLRAEPGAIANATTSRSLIGGIGLEVAAGQLIHSDRSRIVFWNNLWNLTNYQPADGVVGEPDFYTRHSWGLEFTRMRADQNGRLWVIQSQAEPAILSFQLPLKTGVTPIISLTSPLPLYGGGMFTWTESLGLGGIDIQPKCDCLWLSDEENHRVFRVNYLSTQPVVDIVLGQLDAGGIQCNHGRGEAFPSLDSLCHPGALAFDDNGNLFVADHNLEFDGNWRLLGFDASTIPIEPPVVVFGVPATREFGYGRGGDPDVPWCPNQELDPMCGPWEPTFDSQDRMVIGFNGYLGSRFPLVYRHPLTNPLPIGALGDFHSMPLSARFDQFDNLYILDHNRSRILIYRNQEVQTYSVTGTVRFEGGEPILGVLVETVGYASAGSSDASGVYKLTGLVTGTYTLVPSSGSYTFTPPTRTVDIPLVSGGQDFTASRAYWPLYLPRILK